MVVVQIVVFRPRILVMNLTSVWFIQRIFEGKRIQRKCDEKEIRLIYIEIPRVYFVAFWPPLNEYITHICVYHHIKNHFNLPSLCLQVCHEEPYFAISVR